MTYWYTIDTPRDKPCWKVNPGLWDFFSTVVEKSTGLPPHKNELYTEGYVVQLLDKEYSAAGSNGHEA